MTDREMSWTTDHWSGPNDQTYSTLTSHWIDELWEMESCVQLSTIILDYLGVTDTTGSMGVLGQYCRRDNGRRHAYCADHNFHRNAILAFNRELFEMFYQFAFSI
jgi:hypothetical protein